MPIRVYNHVAGKFLYFCIPVPTNEDSRTLLFSVGRSLKPYDLLWPVSRRQDVGMPGTEAKVIELDVPSQSPTKGKLARLPSCEDTCAPFTLACMTDHSSLVRQPPLFRLWPLRTP